jgi:hypothetical protein
LFTCSCCCDSCCSLSEDIVSHTFDAFKEVVGDVQTQNVVEVVALVDSHLFDFVVDSANTEKDEDEFGKNLLMPAAFRFASICSKGIKQSLLLLALTVLTRSLTLTISKNEEHKL